MAPTKSATMLHPQVSQSLQERHIKDWITKMQNLWQALWASWISSSLLVTTIFSQKWASNALHRSKFQPSLKLWWLSNNKINIKSLHKSLLTNLRQSVNLLELLQLIQNLNKLKKPRQNQQKSSRNMLNILSHKNKNRQKNVKFWISMKRKNLRHRPVLIWLRNKLLLKQKRKSLRRWQVKL